TQCGGGHGCTGAADERQAGACGAGDLESATGPQVEQVEEVRGAGDERGTGGPLHQPAQAAGAAGGQQQRGDGGAATDPGDLQRTGGHLPLPQGGEVPAQALDVPVALAFGEVVHGPEQPARAGGDGGRRPGPAGAEQGEGRAGRLRHAAEEADRAVGVVRPLPPPGSAGRASLEDGGGRTRGGHPEQGGVEAPHQASSVGSSVASSWAPPSGAPPSSSPVGSSSGWKGAGGG